MKTIIVLAALMVINGCSLSLPSVSQESNAMLQQSHWEAINTERGSVK